MFKLIPILDKMDFLYRLPRNQKRFETYLEMLQGQQKGDMILPIAGYNPMGKENVFEKIQELKNLNAEELIQDVLKTINVEEKLHNLPDIQVVINVADDVGGAWSNKCTVDYTSKFDIGPLLKRNFCTPYYWSSETFTKTSIKNRALEYAYRTIFCLNQGRPKTLNDYVSQEVYVFLNTNQEMNDASPDNLEGAKNFFIENSESREYSILFNFFYGDKASNELNYPTYGASENLGFLFSAYMAKNKKWDELS
ncbi:MAG: hypothetical protein AAGA43_08550 [Bacteroidota bacterium]